MNHMSMNPSLGNAGVAPWLMPPGMRMPDAETEVAPLKDIPVAELGLRRLHSAGEIRQIAQLRGEIDLSAAAAADPLFMTREKKETNWGWSSHLSSMGSS